MAVVVVGGGGGGCGVGALPPDVSGSASSFIHPVLRPISTKMLPIRLLLLCFIAGAAAQFGRRNMREDMPSHNAPKPSDVDIAMAGWEQLSQNPDKMKDVGASLAFQPSVHSSPA
eukprot:1930605-Prymnesium_polylepis.1